MDFPACGQANPEGAKFCNQCATPLPLHCAKCGTSNPIGSKFCNECAAPLTTGGTSLNARTNEQIRSEIHVNREQSDSAATLDGERKTVTALCADIKGSMEIDGGPRPRGSTGDNRSSAQADDQRHRPIWWLCGAVDRGRDFRSIRGRRSHTKIIRSVHSMLRCDCRREFGATRANWSPTAGRR
jgi:hypothetical protein